MQTNGTKLGPKSVLPEEQEEESPMVASDKDSIETTELPRLKSHQENRFKSRGPVRRQRGFGVGFGILDRIKQALAGL